MKAISQYNFKQKHNRKTWRKERETWWRDVSFAARWTWYFEQPSWMKQLKCWIKIYFVKRFWDCIAEIGGNEILPRWSSRSFLQIKMDVSKYMVNSLHFYMFSVTWIDSFLPAFSLCTLHLILCIETITLPFCLYLLTSLLCSQSSGLSSCHTSLVPLPLLLPWLQLGQNLNQKWPSPGKRLFRTPWGRPEHSPLYSRASQTAPCHFSHCLIHTRVFPKRQCLSNEVPREEKRRGWDQMGVVVYF